MALPSLPHGSAKEPPEDFAQISVLSGGGFCQECSSTAYGRLGLISTRCSLMNMLFDW